MSFSTQPTVVIVPGLRDHVPDHWQTILANKIADARTVPPLTNDRLSRDAQVAALNAALSDITGPVVLVAHSAGVMTTVHWAQRHRHPVKGALLAAPPDFDTPLPEGYPTLEVLRKNGWTPTPRMPLSSPSVVVAVNGHRDAQVGGRWRPRLVAIRKPGVWPVVFL
ncbi:RBBP9/YdeN family alpha/beta hydrolase, partial [Streptomyces sp. NPDC058293]|uniref:RBBP9/YdeN family alpha/beta hydrolase n=1 Tax=Streptomyces sp. NPDC058293 TaxID=3346429 RepID=UPI0036EA3D35